MSFKQSSSSLHLIISAAVIMMLTQACAPGTSKAPVEEVTITTRPSSTSGSVEDMIQGLDATAAIDMLENAATDSSRNRAFELLYKAAEISIAEQSVATASQRVSTLQSRFPESDKSVKLAILNNRLLLKSQQPATIIEALDRLNTRATAEEKLAILDLKAKALLKAGFPIESVQIRVSLDQALRNSSPARQQENDRQLWRSLLQVEPGLVSGHINEIPDTFSGWLELADLVNRYPYNSVALNAELDNWIARNPGHPANRTIIDQIRKKQIATSNHPEHIALVLPLSGQLAPVGTAIRDGFMSAYLESRRIFGTQMTMDIYDTRGEPEAARQAVQNANDRGVEFIIGPLAKEAVASAISANQTQSLPLYEQSLVSTDNIEPDVTPASNDAADTYQFDLAPETEAAQTAERAARQGLMRAMVMVPENIWGNRIYEAFTDRYQQIGGSVVALNRFKKGTADFSGGLKQQLNLDISNTRHKRLESFLGRNLGFTPRRRQDIDVIFIAASPQEARLIKPQLKFFYASDIPVYATSSIYTGIPNARRDKDLENILFCDMPWLLDNKPAPGSLHRTIQVSWPEHSLKYMRFYALGADAFRLLPQLEWLEEYSRDWIAGGTGKLSLTDTGVIQRQLSWATFENGVPKQVN